MNRTQLPHDNEIHLYYLTLPHHPAELLRLEQFLSRSETDRAGRLKDDRVRRRFIAGRGKLREILAGYLGISPVLVHIKTGADGKPSLADPAYTIRFNLSHTGDVLLLAVVDNREVGVDIESMESGKPLKSMARTVFSDHEQNELLHLPCAELQKAFYRFWVRKEACLKASGKGFSFLNRSFDVNGPVDGTSAHTVCCDGLYWQILDIQVPHPYCASLAVAVDSPAQLPPTVVIPAHNSLLYVQEQGKITDV
jgi:4'-phosphopantetheinyl transferase